MDSQTTVKWLWMWDVSRYVPLFEIKRVPDPFECMNAPTTHDRERQIKNRSNTGCIYSKDILKKFSQFWQCGGGADLCAVFCGNTGSGFVLLYKCTYNSCLKHTNSKSLWIISSQPTTNKKQTGIYICKINDGSLEEKNFLSIADININWRRVWLLQDPSSSGGWWGHPC